MNINARNQETAWSSLVGRILFLSGPAVFEQLEHCDDHGRFVSILDRLYALLTLLDNKANGLLRVTGVFIGLIGLYGVIGAGAAKQNLPQAVDILLFLSLLASIVSSVICMFIVRIAWTFFAFVDPGAKDAERFKPEIEALAKTAAARAELYRWAWWSGMGGIAFLGLALIWMAIAAFFG